MAIVVFYGAYYIVKKWRAGESVAFLKFDSKFPFVKPGPMMSPKSTWGPRVDSGLPLSAKNGAILADLKKLSREQIHTKKLGHFQKFF